MVSGCTEANAVGKVSPAGPALAWSFEALRTARAMMSAAMATPAMTSGALSFEVLRRAGAPVYRGTSGAWFDDTTEAVVVAPAAGVPRLS
jgi:hypothetical protein